MLSEYLNQSHKELTIVGPLFNGTLTKQEPILFIDGGAKHKDSVGLSLGDNDSFQGKLDIVLPQEKDFSDLCFALSQIPASYDVIHLLGFLGGRKDHELINLGEVTHFLSESQNKKVLWEDKIVSVSEGIWEFDLNQTFSLFSFTENRVDLTGNCKYSIQKGSLKPYSSHGLSNEAFGKIKIVNENPLHILL